MMETSGRRAGEPPPLKCAGNADGETMTGSWREARFRASARFELKRLEELMPSQREPLRELEEDSDFAGVLVPCVVGTADVKSVNRDGAALFRSLVTPSQLDSALLDTEIEDLVLDGVLEMEADGEFVWGADALPFLCGATAGEADSRRIGRLSVDAVRHAADLESADPDTLATALYLYHRIPISPFWRLMFDGPEAVLAHLGADVGTLASLLGAEWHMTPRSPQSSGWITWHARTTPRALDAAIYKLYVSPRPENIRDTFEAVVRVFAEVGGIDFKIGADGHGLLRPDKFVAYFASRDELDRVAGMLRTRLGGIPAHGVPFTAGIDDDGLLSWGLDPPRRARALRWLGRESWRFWLATKLGNALATAKISTSRRSVEPWKFALERVRRLGVNVEQWTPAEELWSEA